MKTKKILVPTNFSAPSFSALLHAAELAVQQQAEIHLLHVVDPGVWSYIASPDVHLMVPGVYQQYRQSRMEQLQATCRWLLEKYQVPITTSLREGAISTQIQTYAQEIEADMVLLHAPKKLNWWSKLFGYTAGRIAAKVEAPVITLMDTSEEVFNWNNVVIPVEEVVPDARIRTIADLAEKFRITIHFVALGMWKKAGVATPLLLRSLRQIKARSNAPVICKEIAGSRLLDAARSYAEKIRANAMILYNRKERKRRNSFLELYEQFLLNQYPYHPHGL